MATTYSLYAYEPSHILPIVFACIVGVSVAGHVWQNFHYAYWHITFFMFYGGTIFTSGWIVRAISTYHQQNLGLYIAQLVLTLAGPPIYAAAEYNILGRLMHYLPMHAVLNPSRVLAFYIILGSLVETLTGVGAGQVAGGTPGTGRYTTGGVLMGVALVLQACVEVSFMCLTGLVHRRAVKAGNAARNVKTVCYMLYGTSTLILFRCVFRAVETFTQYISPECEGYHCGTIAQHEWFIYAFEAAPMVLYTYWLNVIHPGRFLPIEHVRYLDLDGETERMGPGWIDKRRKWKTFVDPFDVAGARKGRDEDSQFWLRPEEWPVCEDGSFALGTATNVGKKARAGRQRNQKKKKDKKEEARQESDNGEMKV